MNNFPNLIALPEYAKLRSMQPKVDNQDFIPQIIDNIFSDSQRQEIFSIINKYPKDKIRVQKWGGQGVLDDIKISEGIVSTIESMSSKAVGEELMLAEFSIARYSPEYGYEVKLFPHYDTRPVEMFILDIQLKTNEQWGIIVEGQQFNLVDNQSILFSGTQQMHWREDKILGDNAEIYMMFCWLKHKNERKIQEVEKEIMLNRQIVLQKETKILSDESLRNKV
jgi:hypothetical protein